MFDPKTRQRFERKVKRGEPTECWEYQAGIDIGGYGVFSFGRKRIKAHRYALAAVEGIMPSLEQRALHSCDNRACCNPGHLRWGSLSENNMDCVNRRRHYAQQKTHCPKGHALVPGNLSMARLRRKGWRICLTCEIESRKRRKSQ